MPRRASRPSRRKSARPDRRALAEPGVSALISVGEAARMIDSVRLNGGWPLMQFVPLAEAAGRVLAEEIRVDRDLPPFDKALMDGYAVRSADVRRPPAVLRLAGHITAGDAPLNRALRKGEAVGIMTGAPLPRGADAVIPVEEAEPWPAAQAAGVVRVDRGAAAGGAVARRGQDGRRGNLVVAPRTTLGPAHLAVLATVGCGYPMVTVRPRAVVLSTGDELVSHEQSEVRAVQTRDANAPMLQSLLQRLGAEVVASRRVPDRRAALLKAMRQAFDPKGRDADVLFVSGGMSMGEKDHVPGVLRELGFELPVTKLRIRPGKPFVFAVRPADGKFVFGLPGNPVSAFVCTVRLAWRLLRRMTGQPPEPRWLEAALVEAVGPNGPREFYQPAVWVAVPVKARGRGQASTAAGVRCLPWKGSADVFTLARAEVLVVRPENDRARGAGERVQVLEIPR